MGILFKDLVNNAFPALKIEKIKKIGEGDTYVAFLINDHYLFKQAKADEGRAQLRKEVLLMENLSGKFSISTPRFILVSPDYHFGCYEILPGISFDEYLAENELTKTNAKQVVTFLTTLHAMDPGTMQDGILPVMNYFEEYEQDYEFLKKLTLTFFSKKQKEIILEKYESYLSFQKNFEYKPELIHNDFSFNHIICDPFSGDITGVIDFGDAAMGDAAYDFFFLYELPQSIFIEQICNSYPGCDPHFIDRIQFYSFANVMQLLIGCFKEKNDQLIKKEIKKVQNWFKTHLQSVDF